MKHDIKYPYQIFYMQTLKNTLTYEEFSEFYERAIPSEIEYNEYHEILGKLPLIEYSKMVEREIAGMKNKYYEYKAKTAQINSKPIDSDETFNNFIDECIENNYKLFSKTLNNFVEVDETWKI